MKDKLKIGSKWTGTEKTFYIKAVVELEGHTWVHYGEFGSDREYSCYAESFVERFRPAVD